MKASLPTGDASFWSNAASRRLERSFLARLSAFGFGYTALAGSFTLVVLPVRILDLAPADSKNSYLGALSALGLVLGMLTQFGASLLSDRLHNRAHFIRFGGLLTVPLILAVILAPTLPLLFLASCALQLASNVAQGPYQALVRDYAPRERRGAASGLKWAIEVAGALVLAGAAAALVGRYENGHGTGWLLAAGGLLAAAFAVGAALTLAALRRRSPIEDDAARGGSPLSFGKWRFLASRFLLGIGVASLQTYAYYYLQDKAGIGSPSAALWKITVMAAGVVALLAYPAGRLADRAGRKLVMGLGGAFGVGAVLLLLTAAGTLELLAVGALAGSAFGLFLGANWAMASDLATAGRVAASLAVVNAVTLAGASLGKLNGLWVDALNHGAEGRGYTALFALCAILFAAASLLIVSIRDAAIPSRERA